MKKLPIVLAVIALIFLGAHLCVGPVYEDFDGCSCGLCRAWFSFDEAEIGKLRDCRLFMRITSPGDPKHHHEFSDPKYTEYPVLKYPIIIFGLAAVVLRLSPRHQAKVSEHDHAA